MKSPGPMRASTRIFLNGQPVVLPVTGSDTVPDIAPRADMGAFIGHVMQWWNGIVGDVAEVAIFSCAFSEAEIAAVSKVAFRSAKESSSAERKTTIDDQDALWAFRPVQVFEPPDVTRADWPKTGVDHFVLSQLEASGSKPAPPADRRTLIRRAYFDLLGLPPSPEQVESFANDPGGDREVFARLVEQLLASPQYGEGLGATLAGCCSIRR